MAGTLKTVPLSPDSVCTIGRGADSTLRIEDPTVSRRHAAILGTKDTFLLTNLGSANGTSVNGALVQSSVRLKDGDVIGIAQHTIRFGERSDFESKSLQLSRTRINVEDEMVSVVVVDLLQFTVLSQQLNKIRMAEVIGAFLRDSGTVLAAHGSWSQKPLGDAVMGLWRHPAGDAAGVTRQLVSILSAVSRILDIVSGLQARFDLDAPVRAGAAINTGVAAVGNMGTQTQPDFTAIGEVVNRAFRLEAATRKVGADLALSEPTWNWLSEAIHPEAGVPAPNRVAVDLKGYEDPQHAWFLLRTDIGPVLQAIRQH